jgi:hypothetical protein
MTALDADAVVKDYLDRIPRGHEVYLKDPLFHSHMTWLRTMLPILDHQLQADGVSEAARQRAVDTLVYGTPDIEEAIGRLAQYDAELALMQKAVIGDPKPGHQFTGIGSIFGTL